MHNDTNPVIDLLRRRHLHRCRLGVLPRKSRNKDSFYQSVPKLTATQVPETKGRTLEEMDEIFGNGGEARFAAEDAARKDRIERDIGLTAILHGDSAVGSGDDKIGSGTESHEFAEKR
jgi:hypothetical protein